MTFYESGKLPCRIHNLQESRDNTSQSSHSTIQNQFFNLKKCCLEIRLFDRQQQDFTHFSCLVFYYVTDGKM